MKEDRFWKFGFILLFALLLGAVAYFAYTYGREAWKAKKDEEMINLTDMANPASVYCVKQGGTVQMVSDKSGAQTGICLFPDGSQCEEWAYYRQECQKGTGIKTGSSDADLIKAAMLKKINSDASKMLVTVSEIRDGFAKGGVRPVEEGIGGAYFIAAKVGSSWVIVYDGQANPSCSQIADYNFPKDMVPECLDAKGSVVTR